MDPDQPRVQRAELRLTQRTRPEIPWLPMRHVVSGLASEPMVVWSDDRAAIVLGPVSCAANGFGFTVTGHARGVPIPPDAAESDPPPAPATVRVGIVFADDRGVFSDVPRHAVAVDDDWPTLTVRGFRGDAERLDWDMFVAPLPPPGQVTFTFTWPMLGVDRVPVLLDGQTFTDAARRSIDLWPTPPDG